MDNHWTADVIRKPDPVEDDDSGGDWRNARHQILSCMVVDDDGFLWILPYHDLAFQRAGRFQGLQFTLRFTDVRGDTFDMILTGYAGHEDKFRSTIERLCCGKKECIRPRPEFIKSVRFVPVEED